MAQGNGSGHVDIYLRISQLRREAAQVAAEGGEVAAHARQLKRCRQRAAELGKQVRHVFADIESASNPRRRRKDFERMVATNTANPCDGIITWNVDRSFREPDDLERVIKLDMNIHAVEAGTLDLSTAAGRAVARTLVAWAKYEVELKGKRQQEANLQRAEAGLPWRGRRTFGYLADFSGIVPGEAELVKSAFDEVLAGTSLRALVQRWNATGVLTTQGNRWTTAGLRVVLQNPTYAGRRRHKGAEVADLVGTVPVLVDRDTFAAVQAVLRDPARLTSDRGGRGPLYLLSGIVRCGLCGERLHAGTHFGRAGQRTRVWRCIACLRVSRKAEPIEDYVTEVVLAYLRRPGADPAFQSERPDVRPLQRRAADLRAQREALAADLDVDLQFAAARDRRLREELGRVEAEIAAKSAGSALRHFTATRDRAEVWAELSLDVQREVIRELVEVRVFQAGRGRRPFDPDSVQVTPRRPDRSV